MSDEKAYDELAPENQPPEQTIPTWLNKLPGSENPYAARLRANPELGLVSLQDRAAANANAAYYKGTAAGSTQLKLLQDIATAPPGRQYPYGTPEQAQTELDTIRADLARHDVMPAFHGTIEGAAALGGQLVGGAQSPESWILKFPGTTWAVGKVFGEVADTVAQRIVNSALSQAAINVVTDPVAQAGALLTGIEKSYDWARTFVTAPVFGAIFGGAVQGGREAARALARAHVPTPAEVAGTAPPSTPLPTPPAPTPVVEEPGIRPEAPTAVTPEPPPPPPTPHIAASDLGPIVAAMGDHRVATPDGSSVDVRPVVVEARDLITSSDPGYDASLQPRQRERFAAEQQVREMAAQLDPFRLGMSSEADRGAPIVGPDAMVESGNGRVQAIRAAYAEGGDAKARYQRWLRSSLGVDITGMREPVLVRQRLTELTPEQRQAFTVGANQPATLTMSAPERAMADARSLDSDRLALIRNTDDLGAVANRDFVRSFVSTLPQTEQGMVADAAGQLSAEGLTRVRNAVLAAAYGDNGFLSRVLESTHDEVRGISNALVSAAPEWARLRADITRGVVRGDVDMTDELLNAVRGVADLRGAGTNLADHLKQIDAFDKLPGPVEGWMRIFYNPTSTRVAGRERITAALRYYAEEARKVSNDPALDLNLPQVTAAELQRGAAERAAGAATGELQFRGGGTGAGPGGPAGGAAVQRPGVGPSGGPAGATGVQYAGGGRGGLTVSPPSAAAIPATPAEKLRSLHQQAFDLADAIDVPLRQGRLQNPRALGQYDTVQDVIRNRVVADFETVAHEAGHALERHIGDDLTNLMTAHAAELGPLDYDPAQARVYEGFAEFIRHYLTAPAYAQGAAPQFYQAFRQFMVDRQPALNDVLNRSQAAYQDWVNAAPGARIDAMVVTTKPDRLAARIKADGLPQTISLMVGRAYEVLSDENAPAVRAVRSMARAVYEATGTRLNLQGGANPESLVRLFPRSAQSARWEMMNGVVPWRSGQPEGPSLRQGMITATGQPGIFGRWNDVTMKDLANYVTLLRGRELWAKYDAGLIPNRPMAMMKGDVAQGIADYEARYPNFPAGAQQIHEYTRQLLRKMYEGGLIDQELFTKLMAEKFYVPMYRDLSEQPLRAEVPTTGAPRSQGPGQAQLIRQIQGSDRDIVNPIQSIQTQTFMVERTLAHNDIIKSFVNLARMARGAGATGIGRILEEIPAHQVVGKKFELNEALAAAGREHGIDPVDLQVLQGAVTDVFGDDPIMASIFRKAPTAPRGEPIVFWRDAGQLKAVRLISDPEHGMDLYNNLAGLPPQLRDAALNWLAISTTAFRAGITTNPAYAVYNWLKDQVAATILHPGYIPLNPMGIIRDIRGDRWAQMYTYAGGVNPGSAAADLTDIVDRSIDGLARKGWAVQKVGAIGDLLTRGNVKGLGKAFAETMGTTEAGTRLNIFKMVFEQKTRQGLGEWDAMIEAARAASDLPDFGRHGSRTLMMRSLVPFLGSAIQGLDKARRTFIEPLYRAATGDIVTQQDVEALQKAGWAWGIMGLSSALGYAYAHAMADHEAYRDSDATMRATHLIVPGETVGLPGKIITLPKPFELAVGFNLGEMAGLEIAKGDPRIASWAAQGAYEVIAPQNLLHPIPILSTAAELYLNRSFFTGREIVRPELQKLQPAYQYTPQTSSLARWLGKEINVSPVQIEYGVGSMFSLWGRDVMAVSSATDPNAPDQALENTMFLRRGIKNADVASETTQAFWRLAAAQNGEFAQAKGTYDEMVRNFHDSDAREFLASLPATQRAFVTLQSSANDLGKPAFNAEEKRLHPLVRAEAAVGVINGYIKELSANAQKALETGEQVYMNSKVRGEAIESLRVLAAMEERNALVMIRERGYEDRKLLSTEDQFRVLADQSPVVANELQTRYAQAKIYKTAEVAKAWPEAQKRLLSDGSDAELREFAVDVRVEGPAFEGERVRGAQRRRIIPTLPAAANP